MAFTRITDEDRQGKGNVGQPDTPLLTATEMQEQMDSLPNLAIDKHNDHLDELEDPNASKSLGCEAPAGIEATSQTIYAVVSAVARLAQSTEALAHSHANKDGLDSLTDALIEDLTSISNMLNGITEVETSITDNAAAVPSSHAVINYVEGADLTTPVVSALFPIGAIYQTTTVDPDTLFGTSEKWTLLGTDESGIKTYKRIA